MLILSIISIVVWLSIVPFFSPTVASAHSTRMTVMVFSISLILGILLSVDIVEIYHSLFNYSPLSMMIDSLLYVIGILVLVCFSAQGKVSVKIKSEYSLIFIFSILGASIIISAQDIISMYVALELQSFGLYILACMRTDEKGSTSASLKYFLLGAISSAFILLGISIIYQEVGSTEFQNIHSFSISWQENANDQGQGSKIIALGLLSILCGFIFKISAAPFHSWFSDVIQGVPSYTSIIIINLPKISIFTFLFHMLLACGVITSNMGQEANYFVHETFLTMTTLFSLILGTVAGLKQTKMKRLLAFSTISHVGFILIALTTASEASLSAIIFYLVQYTLTVVVTFLVLVAYEVSHLSYLDKKQKLSAGQVNYIVDLQGTGQYYKLLTFTLVLCLFSIAGIPPLTGFYAKLGVLNSSILQNISLIFVTAIICSVISAAYYLKVIKVLMFDTNSTSSKLISVDDSWQKEHGLIMSVSPLHSYTIAVLTAFLCLFILDPELIINCTELVALSLYIT